MKKKSGKNSKPAKSHSLEAEAISTALDMVEAMLGIPAQPRSLPPGKWKPDTTRGGQ